MGNFYTNITVRTTDREAVSAYMQQLRRSCFVSPLSRGYVTVYDRFCDEQGIHALEDLTVDLTRQLRCSAVAALNHDDDVLWLGLARNGNWVTKYRSDQSLSGSAWRMASECGVPGLAPLVWLLMRWPIVVFELIRHHALAWLLGLPKFSVGFGHKYLTEDEWPPHTKPSDFQRIV